MTRRMLTISLALVLVSTMALLTQTVQAVPAGTPPTTAATAASPPNPATDRPDSQQEAGFASIPNTRPFLSTQEGSASLAEILSQKGGQVYVGSPIDVPQMGASPPPRRMPAQQATPPTTGHQMPTTQQPASLGTEPSLQPNKPMADPSPSKPMQKRQDEQAIAVEAQSQSESTKLKMRRIVCAYDEVAQGLVHCSDGLAYRTTGEMANRPLPKKRALPPMMETPAPAAAAGRGPMASSPPFTPMSRPGTSQGQPSLPSMGRVPGGHVGNVGTAPQPNMPSSFQPHKRSAAQGGSWPGSAASPPTWAQPYGMVPQDRKGQGQSTSSSPSSAFPPPLPLSPGYGQAYGNPTYGAKGYGTQDSQPKPKKQRTPMSKRMIPPAAAVAAAPIAGDVAPDTVAVPINIGLIWDGTNVIPVPTDASAVAIGAGPVVGPGAGPGPAFAAGAPVGPGYGYGGQGPASALASTGRVQPDVNPDVVPVPIAIDTLVYPDGQMVILPPDGSV